MNFTSKLVKCSLLVFYVAVCTFLLVRTNYKTSVDRIFDKNVCSAMLDSNTSGHSLFKFEKESIVRSEDLEAGSIVTEEELRLKLGRIHESCEKYNLTDALKRKHFFYSEKHNALYCWIRKVASTSFTKFFSRLRGRYVARNYYREVDFLAPRTAMELKRIINDTRIFKFMIVRHPFHRLVSAYRDRIEDNSRYTAQAWIYVPRIFRLTRPELFRSKGSTRFNAVQRIFNPHKQLKTIPSFEEFVVWLLNEPREKDDVHWSQYHRHCSICNANFDYILNIENYTMNEVNYIFAKLGLDEDSAYLPKIQSTHGGRSNFERTCDYFAALPRSLVERLYERYKIDFEMFDFGYEDYVNCSGKANS